MSMKKTVVMALLGVCGTAAAAFGQADPRPSFIHLSGATLLENLVSLRASTIDFIDVDGNNVARGYPLQASAGTVQQLAPFELPSASGAAATWGAGTVWTVAYGSIGSGNGFQELINTGRIFSQTDGLATTANGNGAQRTDDMPIGRRTIAFFNRYVYFKGGSQVNDAGDSGIPQLPSPITNQANGAGLPIRVQLTGTNVSNFKALYTTGGFNSSLYRGGTAAAPTVVSGAAPGVITPIAGVPSTAGNDGLTAQGGLAVDLAPMDVPASYFARISGTAAINRLPGSAGYGNSSRIAKLPTGQDSGTAGTGTTARANTLASLAPTGTPAVTAANINTLAADANTIFSTPVVFAPVAPGTSFGVGITQIDMSDLRHLFSTGRLISGENLTAITRDSGSGTRNAFQNAVGIDPGFGVGENVGQGNNNARNDILGPFRPGAPANGLGFIPSNKGGNNRIELSVANHRLAIGTVGPERGIPTAGDTASGWLARGEFELLAVRNDVPYGGTNYVRPTLVNLLGNDTANGWLIGGPGVLASFGDPKAAPEVKGGFGWLEPQDASGFSDLNGNAVRDAVEPRPALLNPAMRNVEAAAFVNNFTRSIDAFTGLPGSDITVFTPGELASQRFILPAAQPRVQDQTNPTNLVTNPSFNLALKNFNLGDTGNVYNSSLIAAFGNGVKPVNASNSRAGKVPLRQDNMGNLISYTTEGGAILSSTYNFSTGDTFYTNLPIRNLIAGDFNGDGLRDISDAMGMLRSFRKNFEGGTWTAPAASGALLAIATAAGQTGAGETDGASFASDIVGDFDGNGSFDRADVRYWADGLAMTTGTTRVLDRKAGFIAVDNAYVAAGGTLPFFATTLATGKPYAAGDARGDVIGATATLVTRGWAPTGANGAIDADDISYVYAQFKQSGITGAADWNVLTEAALFDLSADITGDLRVDQADVDELVKSILGTCYGDLNLDGKVTIAERATVSANIGTLPATWARGNLNGDAVIDAADLALACPADFNCDGAPTVNDIFDFLNAWFAGNNKADINGTSSLEVQDIFDFLTTWFAGC
jgi:hypothetical protein